MSRRRPSGMLAAATLAAAFATWSLAPAIRAQAPRAQNAEDLLAAYDTYRSMVRSSPFGSTSWSYLGPTNVSGRATDIAVAERNGQRRIYVGYATSGIWKTDDDGRTWQSIFDHQAATTIGDLAVAPSNPDIIYVGTGEANIFQASMAGVVIPVLTRVAAHATSTSA
ncbi:MAG: hypothetical protein R2752_02880 [Vicinamibacterales bacterium]